MTRQAKWKAWSLVGFVALLLIGIGLAGEDVPRPRAPGPDLEAALRQCNDERAVLKQMVPAESLKNEEEPWIKRPPGHKTIRPR